jgi:hypothetical protein
VPKPAQAYEPKVPVKVREWIADSFDAIRYFTVWASHQIRQDIGVEPETASSQVNRLCRRIIDWRKFLIERLKGC